MSHIMMLVSAEDATLAETRVDDADPKAQAIAEALLRDEAIVSGFSEDEVRSARFVMAGDPPNQP